MKDQKKWGGLLSFVAIFIKIGATFFYIPFVLRTIGNENYGLFAIVSSIIAYVAIVDFGINDSTLRYFVKFRSEENSSLKKQILGSVSSIYLSITLVGVAACVSIYFLLDILFSESFSPDQLVLLKQMFVISSVSIIFTLFFNPTGAILSAYEKFIFLKLTDIFVFLGTTVTIVFFLLFNYGVVTMVLISMLFNVVNVLVRWFYIRKKLKISFPLYRADKKLVKELITYAGPIFVVVIIEQIYWKLDNIIIGSILGPAMVTLYAMGIVFQKYILSFATAISRIMTPDLIRKIDASQSLEVLTDNYIKTSRMQLIVVMLITLNLIFWGKPFITIWLGPGYEESYTILVLILIPFSIEIIGNLRNTFLQVYGFYWHRSLIILVISLINVVCTVIFVPHYGIVAAAISTFFSLFLGYITTNILVRVKVHLDMKKFYKKVWLKFIPTLLTLIGIQFIVKQFINVDNWIFLLIALGVSSLPYLAMIWYFYLNNEEKRTVSSLFKK